MTAATVRRRIKALMAEWDTLRFGLSERDAAEAWAESMAVHEDQDRERIQLREDELLRSAVEQLARDGWNHTNYKGCWDAFPSKRDERSIPEDVDCLACQAIKRLFRVLALFPAITRPIA